MYFICPCHLIIQLIAKSVLNRINPCRLAVGFLRREELTKDSEDIAYIDHLIVRREVKSKNYGDVVLCHEQNAQSD